MDAAIGELGRNPGLCGVIAPAHARIVGTGGIGMVAMGELGHDKADAAKVAARHHGAHVTHQRIAGIAVVHRADPPHGAGGFHQILGLGLGHGHRLFAQHMDPGLEEGFGDFVMGRIGGGDGDKLHPVRAALLAGQHLAPVAVAAVRGEAKALAKVAAGFGVMVKRAGRKGEEPVKAGREAVGRADLAAFAAADHAPVQTCHEVSFQKPIEERYSRFARASSTGEVGPAGSQSCSTVHHPWKSASTRRRRTAGKSTSPLPRLQKMPCPQAS